MRLSITKHCSSPRRRWQILLICLILIVLNLTSSMVYQNNSKKTAAKNQYKNDQQLPQHARESFVTEINTVNYNEILPPEENDEEPKDDIIDLNNDNDDNISEKQNEIESIPAQLSTPLSISSSSTKVANKDTKGQFFSKCPFG